jgi:hypothetical protein
MKPRYVSCSWYERGRVPDELGPSTVGMLYNLGYVSCSWYEKERVLDELGCFIEGIL